MNKTTLTENETPEFLDNKRSQLLLIAVNAKSVLKADELKIKYVDNQSKKQNLHENFGNTKKNLVV